MYHILYLSSLCRRRHWSDPLYTSFPYGNGYACTVSVNQREYTTDNIYETPDQARENAAMKAYLICRNLSVSDSQAAAAAAAAVASAVAAAAAGQYPQQSMGQAGVSVWAGGRSS